MPLFVAVRFRHWRAILDEPDPDPDPEIGYARGIWHYARVLAHLRHGDRLAAAEELDGLARAAAAWGPGPEGRDFLAIAAHVAAAELIAADGDPQRAIAMLDLGVVLETSATRHGAVWPQPVRHVLGAVLLESGDSHRAERVYRAAIQRRPMDGWALFGLAEALAAQGRGTEEAEVRERLQVAWREADVRLVSSRF